MANGFEVIEKGTFDGSSPSVTFTSIPASYSHLELTLSGTSDQASAFRSNYYLKLNDDAGSNYGYMGVYAEHTTGVSTNSSSSSAPFTIGATGGATTGARTGSAILWIFNYSSTTHNKSIICHSGYGLNSGTYLMYDYAAIYRSNSAIDELYIGCYDGSGTVMLDGSSYCLAGWT